MNQPTLLIVDVQRDFCPGGALAVPGGHEVVPLINSIARHYRQVVLTQDWHSADHSSFASQHDGCVPFQTKEKHYGYQVLWPDHCLQGTDGAALHPDLDVPHAQLILRKGIHRHVDSYSTFLEADRVTRTGLDGWLTSHGVSEVHICGLATDFCVAWTAMDARRFGFGATVIEDACRAIDLDGSLARAWAAMAAAGVRRARLADILPV
ncbi:bifunctional nicotinamidase/pyrazinamidase [Roseomonas terrae]|jgi:nicotinamidase/pyrazinamidase|uniref:nicotinamidase n=1 Tax=Neoroseomonas terrae TaxID=424799 RepID=A0ABS5EQT0_9PROT|nr:bifunctional nicotinamidase/pyrazinamidase [Neoroseomonas terrae]MBR0653403.1 bifunctional nicotinamidase/pyrazinamidase [Neoroseomonas terrae]